MRMPAISICASIDVIEYCRLEICSRRSGLITMQIPIKTDENAFEEVTSTRIILGRLVEMRRIKKCPKEIYRESWNLTSPVYRVQFFCFVFVFLFFYVSIG